MFSEQEWRGIVDKLTELTSADKVRWEVEDTDLVTRVADTAYYLGSADDDGVAPWSLTIMLKVADKWQVVDELRSIGGVENETDARTKIAPLRDLAFRMAMGGPHLAAKLLGQLNELDEPF